MKKTGLLGGTFDPVHEGHLHLAEKAQKEFGLDEILFIPAGCPPHKRTHDTTSYKDRVEMLKIALSGYENFRISKIEQNEEKICFTIDTLNILTTKYPDTEFYFIIGLDAFLEIDTWKSTEEVFKSVHFIVVTRVGYSDKGLSKYIEKQGFKKQNKFWQKENCSKRVYFLKDKVPEISSTEIRDLLKESNSQIKNIPQGVLDFIEENRLYK